MGTNSGSLEVCMVLVWTYAADPASMRVVVIHKDLRLQTIYKAPGRVWCVKWCAINRFLYVIHINANCTELVTVLLDVRNT